MPRIDAERAADACVLASYLSPSRYPVAELMGYTGWSRLRLIDAAETLGQMGVTLHHLLISDTLKASPDTMYECRELGRQATE